MQMHHSYPDNNKLYLIIKLTHSRLHHDTLHFYPSYSPPLKTILLYLDPEHPDVEPKNVTAHHLNQKGVEQYLTTDYDLPFIGYVSVFSKGPL